MAAVGFDVRICRPEQTRELRRSVLRPGWTEQQAMPGEEMAGVIHLGAFQGIEVASACLIFPQSCPFRADDVAWQLRSMATGPQFRGAGMATAVLGLAYTVAAAEGAEILWCFARESAVSWYQRNGWLGVGGLFDSAGIAHLRMWRRLAAGEAPAVPAGRSESAGP